MIVDNQISKNTSKNMRRPNTTVHTIPLNGVETIVINYWKGGIAFEHVAVEDKHDCTSLLNWTIVEYDGSNWMPASAAAREKVREEIRRRFERDANLMDMLVTTLMHTLVKLQEYEDCGHRDWIVE